MITQELIGKVAAQYLRENLAKDDETGTARYLLDCLTAEHTAYVAKAILADQSLYSRIDIKLPHHFLEKFGLPNEILTHERTTFFRNATCNKSALLVANTGDDEEQSLKELIPIGAPQLISHPELWVLVASKDIALPENHLNWWVQALKGLIEARSIALDRFADFVLATRIAHKEQGYPIKCALGFALPSLRLPRDTNLFNALNDKHSGHVAKWKKIFSDTFKKRSCYLVKQTPTQGLLDFETLSLSFEKNREEIPLDCHSVVNDFIAASNGWNDQAQKLAECEWEFVKPLFDGLKREKFNLGKATSDFFEERDLDLLSESDRDYLERLSSRKTTQPDEEDEQFYQTHRLELKENLSLKAKWDRFIYGTPIETEDFISGLAQCLQALFDQDQQGLQRSLKISSDKRSPKDLKNLNRDAGLFFSFRYNGIVELLGKKVSWDVGKLFEFRDLDKTWVEAKKPFKNRSVAKGALQIKFFLDLEMILSQGTTVNFSKQLIWKFNPNAISSELHEDWQRLTKFSLTLCEAQRELVSGKGRFQTINLKDVKTLLPSYDKDRGSLIAVYRREKDISIFWLKNLKTAFEENRIDKTTNEELEASFNDFQQKYSEAIQGFWDTGLSKPNLFSNQLIAYSNLLNLLCKKAKGDRNRELLLKPILQIGAIKVDGGPVASIVAPWHPLRMSAMANKTLLVTELVKHLLNSDYIFFGDSKLFFEEMEAELAHPFYPELIIGWQDSKPELLSLGDQHLDYSLHEPPIIQPNSYADTNENPNACADRVIDILKRFLALHPHEQANLSVVLYNCDSARLPQTIVDKIQELHEDDFEMRCQVILRHREGAKLRELYEQIIESADANADTFVASESTRDFMARLRIGIMADEAPPPDESDGPPTDVVFLQDVIARHAQLEWYLEPARPVEMNDWVPSRWSRRRPAASDDLKSVVYLCCPVASKEGWAYLTAITTFLKGDWDGNEEVRLLPARQLNFNDPLTSSIFKEVHNLGNWVVNYDELLDRRQLVNQHVKVIRYKQTDTQGRNILISSNCPTNLLHRMVLKRLESLTLGLGQLELSDLAKKLIEDANLVSGDLVLRAAKRGRNASELIGVVLSKFLIKCEIGDGRYFGWYFLDDYADWLGQKEEQIADILALSPEELPDGQKQLAVVISESKFIDYSSLAVKKKESQKQLRQTLNRISNALFGDPGRLDRDLWLSRFSDMVLNGIHFPANSQLQLSDWRRAIREGNCKIFLRGYSHVFVSGPTECSECSDFVNVAETNNAFQEVFSRAKLRELLLHYQKNSDPAMVRKGNSATDIWSEKQYLKPSERISTKSKPASVPDNKSNDSSTNNKSDLGLPSLTIENISDTRELPGSALKKENDLSPVIQPFAISFFDESHVPSDDKEAQLWLKEIERRTKGALQQFQLQSKLIGAKLTPNAALLTFQGSAQLTIEQILRRRSEFLSTHGIDLISVRAEPGLVVFTISRQNRRLLKMSEVWPKWTPDLKSGNQQLLIGEREEDGSLLFLSPLKNAPHSLIAGSTGSGKSVLMQNIILSIAATNTPQQAKIILIDPKMGVDYFAFEGLPHLKSEIITSPEEALATLNMLLDEMNRRYEVLRKNRTPNITELLAKKDVSEKPEILWVIHDEFAEWMMIDSYKNEVTRIVSRLGVKARAAGIFLVFAAQRPDALVMPMQLRANLGNRLVLRVDSEGTSEIALGDKGAERLLGKGHLAAKIEGEEKIVSAQVPFVAPSEIESMVNKIKGLYSTCS